MAKTKAELEYDRVQHYVVMQEVTTLHDAGEYLKATALAVHAWAFIDGMMQYERRFEQRSEFKSIDSIDYVLNTAPLLFDSRRLVELESLLKRSRRIEKNTSDDLAQRLHKARSILADAHRLWTLLEMEGECRQDQFRTRLGGDQDRWRWIAERWERIGVVERIAEGGSYRVRLATSTEQVMRAKCPSCGVIAKAPKVRLWREQPCPKCQAQVRFVLLSTAT